MNITHATSENVSGDMLSAIFTRQKELMEKYHHIEERSGLLQTPDCPVNLNDKRGQARIKDFSWRVTEEVGEALEAIHKGEMEHFVEELIDGLHFLTELTILSGNDCEDLVSCEGDSLEYLFSKNRPGDDVTLEYLVMNFIEAIGVMCNTLKNKAWKQSQMLTDINYFNECLRNVWDSYFSLMGYGFETASDICDIYLKKSQVNKFRQRTLY